MEEEILVEIRRERIRCKDKSAPPFRGKAFQPELESRSRGIMGRGGDTPRIFTPLDS